jgi:outer membrane lipoprotein-sorting protein
VIKFADVERNAKLAADAFTFVVPKGADVIRE